MPVEATEGTTGDGSTAELSVPAPEDGRTGGGGRGGSTTNDVTVWVQRLNRRTRVLVAVVVAVAIFTVQHLLAASGTVHGTRPLQGLMWVSVSLVVLVGYALFAYRPWQPPEPSAGVVQGERTGPALAQQGSGENAGKREERKLPDVAGVLTATVAAVAAVVGVLQIIDPVEVEQRGPAPCAGVQVRGVPFRASTFDRGANVRSGPGRNFPQVGRFSGDCSIGFVGFCVGLPADDLLFGWPDTRWLELPNGKEFVHGGSVQSLDADTLLPERKCAGGIEAPRTLVLTADLDPSGSVVHVAAESPGAYIVGFAAYGGRSSTYLDLALARAGEDFSLDLGERTSRRLNTGPATFKRLIVGASACLALEAPAAGAFDALEITLPQNGPFVARKPSPPLRSIERDRLARTACLQPSTTQDAGASGAAATTTTTTAATTTTTTAPTTTAPATTVPSEPPAAPPSTDPTTSTP
jgi:hypothetical protein